MKNIAAAVAFLNRGFMVPSRTLRRGGKRFGFEILGKLDRRYMLLSQYGINELVNRAIPHFYRDLVAVLRVNDGASGSSIGIDLRR